MPRRSNAQVSVRSEFIRKRVDEIAARTGRTVKDILEEAVRALPEPADAGVQLIRKNGFLVISVPGGRKITHEEVQAGIDADRERDLFE